MSCCMQNAQDHVLQLIVIVAAGFFLLVCLAKLNTYMVNI